MNWQYLSVGAVLVSLATILPLSELSVLARSSPKLKINKVICIDMQDSATNGKADEPYLEINGDIVWSQKIARGDIKNINLEVPFHSSMTSLDLWERDGDNFRDSKDDYLGSTRIYATQAGFGEQKVVFRDRKKSYHYEIYYQVEKF